jgi:trk system potassium uptake protein
MKTQICIIGIGRFGLQLAKSLARNGMDVLAVDRSKERVDLVKDIVTQAVVIDLVDEESLRAMGIDEIETVIVAIGRNFEDAVLLTRILKYNLEIDRVIVRSVDNMQREILEIVGADQVILPEQDAAVKLADNLGSPFLEVVHVGSNFSIAAIITPDELVGNAIGDLNFFGMYNIRCVAIKRSEEALLPQDTDVIQEHDVLYFAGKNDNIKKLIS